MDDMQILEQLYNGYHLEPAELKRAVVVVGAMLIELRQRVDKKGATP